MALKNPAKQNEPEKFYAMAQAAGEMNFRSLCKDAPEGCTVMRADIMTGALLTDRQQW